VNVQSKRPKWGSIRVMRANVRRLVALAATLLLAAEGLATEGLAIETTKQERRPNVLLLLVDDLKPALGCYGDTAAKTPNIDRLAARGMRFELAYCNQAVCAASRYTLLLGSRATSTGLYDLGSDLRRRLPDAVTLPQFFSQHGYRTESLGKVFHVGHGNAGDPASFDVPHFKDLVIEYRDPASKPGGRMTREEALFANEHLGEISSLPRGAAFESPEVSDEAYADSRVATETIRRLQEAATRREADGTPFLIAAGFVRPHLPFSVPQRYWDLHDPDALPKPASTEPPRGAPDYALKRGGEIAAYTPVPESGDVDEALARRLVHGYYASASYVDAQIGRVIDEMERLGLFENTIVVLWGDHGFHLGDHGFWTKHTNYEQATRIPLIVLAPGVTKASTSSLQPVESVDVFPTLAALAGLPDPTGPQPIDGENLLPVLADPEARLDREHALHCFPRRERLGCAVRTARYRLVEWRPKNAKEAFEYELYDYQDDPHERVNVAAERPDVVATLAAVLANEPLPVMPGSPPGRAELRKQPNVVVVFIDDMGWGDLSCFGNTKAHTPEIDRLAAEGLRFEQFYVASPICSPSRCGLLTGQYPQRWQITSYLNNREDNHRRGVAQWLDPEAPTIAKSLKAAGYATGHFGKWHLGGQRDVDDAPAITTYGFDESLTNFEGMGAKLLPLTMRPGEVEAGRIWGDAERLGGPVIWMQRSEITRGFADAAVAFINRAVEAEQPFYVNIWPDDVHSPFWPPVDDWAEDKEGKYLAVLEAMDRQFARLFAAIRRSPALRDNTLVLFCSDNGPEPGAGSAGPFRGFKTQLYEGGVRSPLIVWGPGLLKPGLAGSVNKATVLSAIDLAPSLLAMAGTQPPEGVEFDGLNRAQALLGFAEEAAVRPLFWRRPPDRKTWGATGTVLNPDLAMRRGNWKLLCDTDGGDVELFDLEHDRGETNDVAAEHPQLVDQMKSDLLAWHHSMPADAGDQLGYEVEASMREKSK
jgi:iduronate 2-sulfatase